MTRRQRIAAWVGWLLPWAIVGLDYIGRIKDILELPGNARSVVGAMVDALGNTSWQAIIIFLIGLACLLFATSHLWMHWFRWTITSTGSYSKSEPAPQSSSLILGDVRANPPNGWTIRVEPMIAPSDVPLNLSQQEGAFVALSNHGLPSVEESHNVTSITDIGHNQFTVCFDREIDPKRVVCTPVGTTPQDFEVSRMTPLSADIKFKGAKEPTNVALWFHAANVPTKSSNDPDLTIGELFRGLLPHPVEDAPDWLTVGNEVRDKASLGRLRIWGRPCRYWDYPEQARSAAVAAPLEPIGPSYWRDAQFNWGTVFEPQTHLPHTVPLPHKFMTDFQRYNGLRVNRKEALDIWPERLKPLTPPASSGFST